MRLQLKICGMRMPSNITEVAALQPDYLGFIFYEGSKRFVGADFILPVGSLPEGIKKVGVFVNADLSFLKATIARYQLDAVQLHGDENPVYCAGLQGIGVEVMKAFGINEAFDFEQLNAYEPYVDYFLFDTQTADHGGSGRQFDWGLLRRYPLNVPYFLSGGIDLQSLPAIAALDDPRFYAVDVNSKFEISPGLKNLEQLNEFKNTLTTIL